MDRRVPAPAPLRSAQCLSCLRRQLRVLEDRLRKPAHDRAVQPRIRRLIDRRSLVLSLQIEHAHAPRRGDLAHVLVRPVADRVELELELRVVVEPRPDLEPRRDDEAHGPILAADHGAKRQAVLAQGEVERGALERPAPVVL